MKTPGSGVGRTRGGAADMLGEGWFMWNAVIRRGRDIVDENLYAMIDLR